MLIEALEWDSQFFEMPVVRLTMTTTPPEALEPTLSGLRRQGVRLVYVYSAQALPETEVLHLGGLLVDAKTTFVGEVSALDPASPVLPDSVRSYSERMPLKEIEAIAIQAGAFSRFFIDPRIPQGKGVDLYRIWLARSLAREIADDVLVIREADQVLGLVTLGGKRGRGDIGLLAVRDTARGKGYGRTLVHSAQRWFGSRGFAASQVVTQGANLAACSLYSSCGFHVETVEYVYHFWIGAGPTAASSGRSTPALC